jgi:nitrite reductase/ring-hydroxylating ferredoxin subunit
VRWSAVGPEALALQALLRSPEITWLNFSEEIIPTLDGLLLAGALSAVAEAQTWLWQLIHLLREGAVLLVIDWQDDGLLTYGPDLSTRFKKGRLCRFLRENSFGLVETVEHQPLYYVVNAIKGPAPAVPHATELVEVASLAELPKNGMKLVKLFDHKIVVANTGKEIVAFAATCPHAGGLLSEGRLRGRNVVCPLHAYIWNVRTGEPVEPVQEDTLRRYTVQVDRGRVLVALAEPSDCENQELR